MSTAAPPHLPAASVATKGVRPLRILFADDVPELRDVARISLGRDGHRVACVEDGALALERYAADRDFDLVITDHHMPNLNGLGLVAGLRTLQFPGRILVFSSELGDAATREYERLAVDRILYKPVFPSALRQILAELFPPAAAAAA